MNQYQALSNQPTIKHLEFIQNVITRMNINSFQIKRMAILLISAFCALYIPTKNPLFIGITIFPTLLFWFLDAYYLMIERKFRGLYKDLIKDPSAYKPFDMNIQKYTGETFSFKSVLFSKSIVYLYGMIIAILILAFLILHCI